MTEEVSLPWYRRLLTGVSVATRISSAVVVVSLLSLIVATVIGLNTGRRLGQDLFTDQISAMSAAGSFDVTTYLNSLETTAELIARSPQAPEAVKQFSEEVERMDTERLEDKQKRAEALAEAYQEQYIDPLGEAGRGVDIRSVINADNNAALYLQSTYSIDFEPVDRAAAVDDARDGTVWTEAHRQVHPTYRRISDQLALSDLLLVDTTTGRIVYSVEKRPDLGASVLVGPVSGSIVATLVDRVVEDPGAGVQAADFRRYDPSVFEPVAGMAAPIIDDDGDLVGAFVLLFDSTELTRILTADGDWNAAEFPTGGELYLIGSDFTTRSEPRGYLEYPEEYLDAAEVAGQLSDEDRAVVDLSGTTVLTLRAADVTAAAAEDSDEDVERRLTIDGRQAISSVDLIPYDGFDMWMVAEVDSVEAAAAIDDFEALLIVGVAIFMVVLAFLAVAWATSIMRPVRSLSDRLGTDRDHTDDPVEVPDRSPVEFHRLAARFLEMAERLRGQRSQLAVARQERLALMRRMLPTSVAERLDAGDAQALDEAPDASVVVLTIVGLSIGEATPAGPQRDRVPTPSTVTGHRAELEGLLSELDDLARHHGLEPVKIIGDEYYAAIGHDRPYIDHAPRAVSFAAEALAVLNASSIGEDGGVELAAGIASGPVTVGLSGTRRLVYDLWGDTVRRADQLARRAPRGRLLAADETTVKLPDDVVVEEFGEVVGQTAWLVDDDRVGERS